MSLLSSRDVFICRTCLSHNCSVEEKLEFKRGEDLLEEMDFFYLGDMISSYGVASEVVSARIGSAWKKVRVLSGVLVGKQDLSRSNGGRFISVVLDQFGCTFVKRGNLLLRVRRVCKGWSVV